MPLLRSNQQLEHYTVQRLLGVGGDGEVWEVTDDLGERYALKARPTEQRSENFHKEFERLRRLRIPGIIKVHSSGESNGVAYYTMDIATGVNLRQYLRAIPTPKQKVEQCLQTMRTISFALSNLHRLGIAHLDIKPDNILVNQDGYATLVDFGRAMMIGEGSFQQQILGSMAYMAPEQRSNFPTSPKSDVYALGVTIYEVLTEAALPYQKIGEPWPSLSSLDAYIPLALADLVHRCLSLPVTLRPTMEHFHIVVDSLLNGHRLPQPNYPSPPLYVGPLPDLLGNNHLLVGPFGSGKKRLVLENLKKAYHQGHMTLVGRCHPTQPFQPFVEILSSLFQPLTTKERQRLAKTEAAQLKYICPKLPILVPEQSSNDEMFATDVNLKNVAKAVGKVFQRCAPITIAFFDLEKSDPGTLRLLRLLWRYKIDDVTLLATSTHSQDWTKAINPPLWSGRKERQLLHNLLPLHIKQPSISETNRPIHSCIKGWNELAKWRDEAARHPLQTTKSLASLSMLQEPFPKMIAAQVAPNTQELLDSNILYVSRKDHLGSWLRFSFEPQRQIARQSVKHREIHRLMVKAWRSFPVRTLRLEREMYHRVLAGNVTGAHFQHALEQALIQHDAAAIRRWLVLLLLFPSNTQLFSIRYAKAYVSLKISPGELPFSFVNLQHSTLPTKDRLHSMYLMLAQAVKHRSVSKAEQYCQQILILSQTEHLELRLAAHREMGVLYAKIGDYPKSIHWCIQGLQNVSVEALNDNVKKLMLGIHILLSATQIYALDLPQAIQACSNGYNHSTQLVHYRTAQASFLVNWAIAEYQMGNRNAAQEKLGQARDILEQREHLLTHAYCALLQGRLAVEKGESKAGIHLLEEAISIAQSVKDEDILGEAYSVLLDAAVQMASPKEAHRAIQYYQRLKQTSNRDHWPASLARWYWLQGDIDRSLEVLNDTRQGFSHYLLLGERVRALIISGQYNAARALIETGLSDVKCQQLQDVVLFLNICKAAVQSNASEQFTRLHRQAVQHQWTEIYLGILHLEAIHNRIQHRDIENTLKILQSRAKANAHQLYIALGDARLW